MAGVAEFEAALGLPPAVADHDAFDAAMGLDVPTPPGIAEFDAALGLDPHELANVNEFDAAIGLNPRSSAASVAGMRPNVVDCS